MDVSVVVPTLNGRAQLTTCLDALSAHAPEAEVVVVNGPSSDGTTGTIRDRDDVDALVEISDRNRNVARNAGIAAASGDAIAIVGYDATVESSWYAAVTSALADGADAVTGPTHRSHRIGMTTDVETTETVAGTAVTYCNAGNVALTRDAVEALDGFDEGIDAGGTRDLSHRLARTNHTVVWNADMSVRTEYETDGGRADIDWGDKYASLVYRLVKNYGTRPSVATSTVRQAVADAWQVARDVTRGEATPTGWLSNGQDVVRGIVDGAKDGVVARRSDPTPRRNPNGLSARHDRAVQKYDWRE